MTHPTLVASSRADADILLGHDFEDVRDPETTRHAKAEDPSQCLDSGHVGRAAQDEYQANVM